MDTIEAVTALSIGDERFLVNSLIERCPKSMMVRELFMNACEAAAAAGGQVRLDSVLVEGIRKLRFWNTGPGLSPRDLHRMCDIASSIRKMNGLDQNFGMGAKVAALPSNRHGMRYRSCHEGRVTEVVLCQRDGIYGRLQRAGADGESQDLFDVTAEYAEGALLQADWTEVVLLGNEAGQDTVSDPYQGSPASSPGWLEQKLRERFHTLHPKVQVTIAGDLTESGRPSLFRPDWAGMPGFRTEAVETRSGIVIHYGFLPPSLQADPSVFPGPGAGAVVHRGEIYAAVTDADWLLLAPELGISFAAQHCSVVIEIPADYPVRADGYREVLRYHGGSQRLIALKDFGAIVSARMPVWLARLIQTFAPPEVDYQRGLAEELMDLISDLGVPRTTRPNLLPRHERPDRVVNLTRESERPRRERDPSAVRPPPSPPKPEASPADPAEAPRRSLADAPEIIIVTDEAEIEGRSLRDRAARFYLSNNKLYVNGLYRALQSGAERLAGEFAEKAEPKTVERLARRAAEWAMVRRVARGVVHGLTKKTQGWGEAEVERAMSPEALSLLADDLVDSLPEMRLRIEALIAAEAPAALTGRAA
ncbi:ATP-binding protein [Roseococcus sp.]|uniref:ATP-binding protein n=1 Tax=Roseococcus sp. TaxID=2109646 RepID=UPI003BAA9E89